MNVSNRTEIDEEMEEEEQDPFQTGRLMNSNRLRMYLLLCMCYILYIEINSIFTLENTQ